MSQFSTILKHSLKNKVLHYIFSRYFTYLVQFINSLFIAVYLGPYYLGIWGFITLIIQYLNHINFGIAHSVNAIISINKNKDWYVQKVIGTSLTMLIGLSLFVVMFFIVNGIFNFDIGSKYNFSTYAPAVALIGILGYFNSLLSSVFRVYGRVTEIAINQSAFPFLMLLVILIFKGESLIWALVGANLSAFFLSLCLYLIKSPVKLKPLYISRLIKKIQVKGWYLFIYNTSFYFIVISTRSFVSAFYSVEEFGYFTFAFALANVMLLLLQSFSFLIFPKLLNRLAAATNDKVDELLRIVRDAYITTSHLLIHIAILFFPLFMLFFPEYTQSVNAFKFIALTVVLYTNSFGYTGLLIARNYERKLSYLSIIALIVNVFVAYILTAIFYVPFEYVVIATMVTYFIYPFFIAYFGKKILGFDVTIFSIIQEVFTVRLFAPYLISLGLVVFSAPSMLFIVPLLLFIFINLKQMIKVIKISKSFLSNPDFINI